MKSIMQCFVSLFILVFIDVAIGWSFPHFTVIGVCYWYFRFFRWLSRLCKVKAPQVDKKPVKSKNKKDKVKQEEIEKQELIIELKQELEELKNRTVEPVKEEYKPRGSKKYTFEISEQGKEELQHINKLPRFESIDAAKELWSKYYKPSFDNVTKEVQALNKSGIYVITNKENNKVYVGKSKEIKKRWAEHIRAGMGADLKDSRLYRDMYIFGPENFIFQVIDYCDEKLLNEREAYWINHYNSFEEGYNSTRGNKVN